MLVVYVDDFRMAGPTQYLTQLWNDIKTSIQLGDVETSGKFLGCECKLFTRVFPAGGDPWRDYTPKSNEKLINANCIEYDMESFLSSCVEKYCELAKMKRESLKKVNTPFIDEAVADKEWEKTVDNQIKDGKLDEKQILEISNKSDNHYDASVIMASPAKAANRIKNRLAGKEKIVTK